MWPALRRWRRLPPFCLGIGLGLVLAFAAAGETAESGDVEGELLPHGELFEPLIADLRWPRFSAAHQWRLGTDEFDRAGTVSFGETFALYRDAPRRWGRLELGFFASVYALFDMASGSFDLANEDYQAGFSLSLERGEFVTLLRAYHVSSHLGDEYLIENRTSRDDVSFEIIDLLVSRPLGKAFRLYGGLGVVVNATNSIDPFRSQGGLEWTSPTGLWGNRIRPIAGTDLQIRQENDFEPEVAVLVGLRLARPEDDVRRLELFARYYHGRSPEGQFFDQTIDSIGVGLRLGF